MRISFNFDVYVYQEGITWGGGRGGGEEFDLSAEFLKNLSNKYLIFCMRQRVFLYILFGTSLARTRSRAQN